MAKLPVPSDVEAERVVLGSILLDPDAAVLAMSMMVEDDFSNVDVRNKIIFSAMKELDDKDLPIDVTSITDMLINTKKFEDAGGSAYLYQLIETPISTENVEHYIKIIQDQATLRRFLAELNRIQSDYASGKVVDVGEFVYGASQVISHIATERNVGGIASAGDISLRVHEKIKREIGRGNQVLTGVDTGFIKLNQLTHGWQPGNLIVLAARPAVGKTAFALNLALNAARGGNKSVLFFSCEMSADEIMGRVISCVSRVEMDKIQTGSLDDRQMSKIASAIEEISGLQLYFDDTPGPKIGDLEAKAQKFKATHPDLSLIVIDYVGLIKAEAESRTQEVGKVTKALKNLARNLSVPVIALAQLNRNVEANDNHIPMLSNLKESGDLEQEADLVMLMYRHDYYKNQGIKSDPKHAESFEGRAEAAVDRANAQNKNKNDISAVNINLAKNRHGSTGTCTLFFSKAFSLFDNPTEDFEEGAAAGMGE